MLQHSYELSGSLSTLICLCDKVLYCCLFHVAVVWRTGVPMIIAEKQRQDGPECQKDACFVVRSIALFEVLVMTNELHLGE
jgi:hypothetical protein